MIHRLPCEILVMMVKKLMHGKKSEHTHQELRYPKGEGRLVSWRKSCGVILNLRARSVPTFFIGNSTRSRTGKWTIMGCTNQHNMTRRNCWLIGILNR